MSNKTYRNYALTYFPQEFDWRGRGFNSFEEWALPYWGNYVMEELIPMAKYIFWAREYCETTGKLHIQGFIIWKNPRSLSALCKAYKHLAIQWSICSGTIEDNLKYCKKGLQPKAEWLALKDKGPNYGINACFDDWGEKPKGQGKRTDLLAVFDQIKNGEISCQDLIQEKPILFHQYGRTFKELEDVITSKKRRNLPSNPRVCWIDGPAGSGKSHVLYVTFKEQTGIDLLDPKIAYDWSHDRGWWDLYDGQPIIIFNDYDGEIPLREFLKILDKFPCSLSRRSRAPRQCLAHTFFITSTKKPEEVYGEASQSDDSQINAEWKQLERRITERVTLEARETPKPEVTNMLNLNRS